MPRSDRTGAYPIEEHSRSPSDAGFSPSGYLSATASTLASYPPSSPTTDESFSLHSSLPSSPESTKVSLGDPLPPSIRYVLGRLEFPSGSGPAGLGSEGGSGSGSGGSQLLNISERPNPVGSGPAHNPSKRWIPPFGLPPVRSDNSNEGTISKTKDGGGGSETAITHDVKLKRRGRPPAVHVDDDRHVKDVPTILTPPPKSSLRVPFPKASPNPLDDDRTLFTWAVNNPSPPGASVADSTRASVGHDSVRESINLSPDTNMRQSTTSIAMTDISASTATTALCLMDVGRTISAVFSKFGTSRTMTTETTSEMPSITRTEGSSVADDLARKYRESSDAQQSRYRNLSDVPVVDPSRVVEKADESGSSSRGAGRDKGKRKAVEFPRAVSGEHVMSGSNSPQSSSVALSDDPSGSTPAEGPRPSLRPRSDAGVVMSSPLIPCLRLKDPEGDEQRLMIDCEAQIAEDILSPKIFEVVAQQYDDSRLFLDVPVLQSSGLALDNGYMTSIEGSATPGSALSDGFASLGLESDSGLSFLVPPYTDSTFQSSILLSDGAPVSSSSRNLALPASNRERSPGSQIRIETNDLPQHLSLRSAALSPGSSDISLPFPFTIHSSGDGDFPFPSPLSSPAHRSSNTLLSDSDASGPRGETMRGRTCARDRLAERHSTRHSLYRAARTSRSTSRASGVYTPEDQGVDGDHIDYEPRPQFPRMRNWSGSPSYIQPGFLDSGRPRLPRRVSDGEHFVQDGLARTAAWLLSQRTATIVDEDSDIHRSPPIVRPQVASQAMVEASSSNRRKTDAKYNCEFSGCKATFTAKHNLQNHINSHLGIRGFNCVKCKRDFGTAHVLRRHMKTCKGKRTLRKSPSPDT